MRFIIWLAFILLITACGNDITRNPDTLQAPIFIIAGQSDATGVLNALVNIDSHTANIDITTPINSTVGSSVIGTAISYWLDDNNTAVLRNLLETYCTSNTQFIWIQGGSDAFDTDIDEFHGEYLLFKDRTELFFSKIMKICPTLKINLVRSRLFVDYGYNHLDYIIDVQNHLGYPIISQDDLPSDPNGVHRTFEGYKLLLQRIYDTISVGTGS